jgi:hypothetical protein
MAISFMEAVESLPVRQTNGAALSAWMTEHQEEIAEALQKFQLSWNGAKVAEETAKEVAATVAVIEKLTPKPAAMAAAAPEKRKRGRPPGSKNENGKSYGVNW